jgi:protein-S-isoprenylcysteine O-methyltransferase Ste14
MRIRMVIGSVVWTAVFLALAAWPYGSTAQFLAHPARLALVVVTAAALVVAFTSRTSGLSSGVREDKRNRWILAPLVILSLGVGLIPSWSDVHEVWVFDSDTIRYIGVVLFAIGLALRLAPTFILGRRFSGLVAIQPDHTLETRGLYSHIRHPSYLGLLVSLIGWSLVFRSLLGLLLALGILWLLVCRMNAEERLLAEQFGESYDSYRKRTWRLIPYLY